MVFPLKRLLILTLPAMVISGQVEARDVPKPRLKPDRMVELEPDSASEPVKPLSFPRESGNWPKDVVARERTKCARILKDLNLDFEALAPLGNPNGCGAAAPILIKAIKGTRIVPPAEATCDFAEQLHGWVTSSLQPSASSLLGRELVQIDNASAYVCRRRNNSASGKLSEHAKANALDIAKLHFAGEQATTIRADWSSLRAIVGASRNAKFLARIRRDACIRFTTVLGPGADRYHGDHFHVDYVQRKSGYRICK
jgi:hypothetical protein